MTCFALVGGLYQWSRMIKRFAISTVFLGSCLVFTACGEGLKEQVGLTKQAPDEFAVIKRAPLEMPPTYSLRPPTPGAPRPQEQETSVQAKQAVFGMEQQPAGPAGTDGESVLLYHAGANEADPNIRPVVDRETYLMRDRNKPVAEKLLGIGGNKNEPSATVVDAEAEAERLRQNMEEGKPVTEGETPSIED